MIPIEHTVAEDLLLLLLDERSGAPVINVVALDHALGGALLVELAERGRVGPSAAGSIHVETGRRRATTFSRRWTV